MPATEIHLDPLEKCVRDDKVDEYTFDKILLATGGSPNRLPFGDGDIIYYRDLQVYHRLRALSERGENFLVIGGRFIGSEIAAALTMVGKKSSWYFPKKPLASEFFQTTYRIL